MALFGDNPFGWRIASTLAGTATVLGVFAFLWLHAGNVRTALVGAVLTTLNQTVYVQARTGMLDRYSWAPSWSGRWLAFLWAMKAWRPPAGGAGSQERAARAHHRSQMGGRPLYRACRPGLCRHSAPVTRAWRAAAALRARARASRTGLACHRDPGDPRARRGKRDHLLRHLRAGNSSTPPIR